jgi:hypothetical protein
MILLAQAQHFVRAPEWTWYIVPYFFLAGLAGGSYFMPRCSAFGASAPTNRRPGSATTPPS